MNHLWSLRPRDVWIWVNTVFKFTSQKTEIARSVRGPKKTRATRRKRIGGVVPRAANFGDLIAADHKVLSEKVVNLETISKQSSICSRGAGLGHPMDPVVPVQNKDIRGFRNSMDSTHPCRTKSPVLNVSKRTITFHFSSKQDCNSAGEVPSLLCAPLSHQYNLSRNGEALMYDDPRIILQYLCQIPRNCQCKLLLRTKTSQETQKSLQKFLEPTRKPKAIYTDNSLEFGKACEDLSWNIVHQRFAVPRQMVLLR